MNEAITKYPSITQQHFHVRGYEITPAYLLRKTGMIQLMFECFAYECSERALAGYDLQAEGKSWILSEWYIEYGPLMPKWKEEIRIQTWTRSLDGLRMVKDFKVFHNDNVIAAATSNWLIINEQSRRPLPSSFLKDKYTLEPREAIPDYQFNRMNAFGEAYSETKFTVRPNDIDFNQHLNSIRYITEALDSIPSEYRDDHHLHSIQAKFMQEVMLGDRLLTQTTHENGNFFHTQTRLSDQKEACRLVSKWRKKQI